MFTYACTAAVALVSIAGLADGAGAVMVAEVSVRREVQQPDEQAVEARARRFRLQIYSTYRLDRGEFERRRAAWQQIQARWRNAGSDPTEREALMQWLVQATEQSRPGIRGALPEAPRFGRMPKPVETRIGSERKTPRDVAGDKATPMPERDNRGPSRRAITRSAVPAPSAAPEVLVSPTSREPVEVSAPLIKPKGIDRPRGINDVESPARTAGTSTLSATAAPAVPGLLPKQIPLGLDANPRPVESRARGFRPNLNGTDTLPIEGSSGSRDVPAIAAQKPRSGDVEPHAADTGPPRRVALARPTTVPAARDVPDRSTGSALSKDARRPNAATFNLGELWARASGYRDGLRTVESALLGANGFGPTELEELLDELEDLLNQRRELSLYEQVVSAQDRERLIRSLGFPQAAVAGLGSLIARARERLLARTFDNNTEQDRQLQKLEELSLRLSKLHQE